MPWRTGRSSRGRTCGGRASGRSRRRAPWDAAGCAAVVGLDLEDGALLAFLCLVVPLLQPAGHDDPHAALQRLGDVLRRLPPYVAGQEEAVAVLPLVGRLVHEPGRRGDAEGRD